jgi:hypothetical protein
MLTAEPEHQARQSLGASAEQLRVQKPPAARTHSSVDFADEGCDCSRMNTEAQQFAALNAAYAQACSSLDRIADFRARLLALLPIASGAGLLVLIEKGEPSISLHLLPIGIFGVLVTIGLFYYELRGIQHCNGLISSAQKLERALLGQAKLSKFAPFTSRRPSVLRVGASEAALWIYPSVAGAWTYIATGGELSLIPILVSGAVAVGLAMFGHFVMRLQGRETASTTTQGPAGD